MSREHYISNAVLQELNRDNDLRVSGFRWLADDEVRPITPSTLVSRILCDRHNWALSPLDRVGWRLFHSFNEEDVVGSRTHALGLFSGIDIERWLLKVLCGIVFSGNMRLKDDVDTSIPREWVEILFGRSDFADDQGLYVCRAIGHRYLTGRDVRLNLIVRQGRLSGIGLWMCGYELILSMYGFPSRRFDNREVVYRPLELYTTGREYEKSIMLSWQGPADLGTITVSIDDTQ